MNARQSWQLTIVFFALPFIDDGRSIAVAGPAERSLIDFSDRKSVTEHRPIIVAHRGGVISKDSAECSLSAIRLASDQGYDMVELDVQKSRDGVPMLFHDRTMQKACGRGGRIEDFRAKDLEAISYRVGNDRIVRLETAMKLCRQQNLGVMLDLKAGRDDTAFLSKLDQLVSQCGLSEATISISGSDAARQALKHVCFTPTADEMRRLRAGEELDLSHRFWFGLPQRLQPGDVTRLRRAGALIIPAINTFRYPADRHFELAKEDVERLSKQGVDGFQIDSIYYSLFVAREGRSSE